MTLADFRYRSRVDECIGVDPTYIAVTGGNVRSTSVSVRGGGRHAHTASSARLARHG